MQANPRITFSSRCRGSILVAAALILAGCSGGGGGGTVEPGPGPGPNPNPRTAQTAVFLTQDGLRVMAAPDDASSTGVELSASVMTGVRQFAVSPDGGAVAYIADGDTLDRFELYVAEIGGAAPTRVSTLMNAFNDAIDLLWAPDSQSLAYRADGIVDDRAELFRVNRDGSGHYRVYQSGIASIYVAEDYGWSVDSRYLYCTLQQTTTKFELRLHDASTGSEGSDSVLFVPPGREILDVTFSPDSQLIAMRADHLAAVGQFEVFRRATDFSSALIRSNGTVGPWVKINEYSWSPDSRWLAQKVHDRTTDAKVGVNVYDVTAGASRRVFDGTFEKMDWAPASSRLAIAADFDPITNSAAGELRLLVHDADVDTLATVNDMFTGGEQLRGELFDWSPDGQRLAYVTRVTSNQEYAYHKVVSSSQPAVRALDVSNLEVTELFWSPDSARLGLLERNQNQAFHPGEWHVVGSDGRSVFRSGTINTYFITQQMRWSSDSGRVVYAVDAAQGGPSLLRSVAADGTGDVAVSGLEVASFEYARATLTQS